MNYSIVALGLLAGMSHAFEPDHMAAVGAMATGKTSRRALVLRGVAWGVGHTITLFLICSAVILLGMALSDRTAAMLESAVGVMLVVIGSDVLYRMHKARVHLHVHEHQGGARHFHAHSHLGETAPHDARDHQHRHRRSFPVKAFLIGLVHGSAGSAALLALAVATVPDPWQASLYVLLFGLGSLIGMSVFSYVASWPLGLAERFATRFHQGLSLSIALIAGTLGLRALMLNAPIAWGAV